MAQVVKTGDGSYTLKNSKFGEYYHSVNGAISESSLVFIKNGLLFADKNNCRILEYGFGTGLNAVLSHLEANRRNLKVHYTGVELFPLGAEETESFYTNFEEPVRSAGIAMNQKIWNLENTCGDNFTLLKLKADFTKTQLSGNYDVVFFDAFSPESHPEAWKPEVFQHLYEHTAPHGILVTYSAQGKVKQALRNAGYQVSRLPGPPGKRHILRAIKF
ncbi:MAG: tRNA (5-methylaminomethyl-2-thiouridine)(34)-methyltransferase MnmD [Bacteroidota bacterium]